MTDEQEHDIIFRGATWLLWFAVLGSLVIFGTYGYLTQVFHAV